MPTYEYKCEACGHAFEKFQSIKAGPIRKCPKCGKMRVKKLISKGAGLIFKGSGFYITDYRSEGYKDQAKADSAGGSGGGGEAKTESKDGGSKEAKTESQTGSSSSSDGAAAKSQGGKTEAKPVAQSSPKSESKPDSKPAKSDKK